MPLKVADMMSERLNPLTLVGLPGGQHGRALAVVRGQPEDRPQAVPAARRVTGILRRSGLLQREMPSAEPLEAELL